jgi:deazaflavin-dependent oxidoreductase (nitroreductase family)
VSQPSLEADLASWGKVIRLRTRGHRSGLERTVTIGFVEDDDGSLLVAAASESTAWAANLTATPACVVERDGDLTQRRAVPLDGPERASAVTRLILKYGAPAERLGAGPAFRLLPRE